MSHALQQGLLCCLLVLQGTAEAVLVAGGKLVHMVFVVEYASACLQLKMLGLGVVMLLAGGGRYLPLSGINLLDDVLGVFLHGICPCIVIVNIGLQLLHFGNHGNDGGVQRNIVVVGKGRERDGDARHAFGSCDTGMNTI